MNTTELLDVAIEEEDRLMKELSLMENEEHAAIARRLQDTRCEMFLDKLEWFADRPHLWTQHRFVGHSKIYDIGRLSIIVAPEGQFLIDGRAGLNILVKKSDGHSEHIKLRRREDEDRARICYVKIHNYHQDQTKALGFDALPDIEGATKSNSVPVKPASGNNTAAIIAGVVAFWVWMMLLIIGLT